MGCTKNCALGYNSQSILLDEGEGVCLKYKTFHHIVPETVDKIQGNVLSSSSMISRVIERLQIK